MPRLANKTALITGASRGIGRAIAKRFAEAGAAVAVNHPPVDAEADRAADLVSAIEDEDGAAVRVAGDVSDEGSVREMIETVQAEWGPIDVLVNNAGILTQSRMEDMSVEMWDETIAVDLRGVFLVTRFVLPGMLRQGSGKIINITSQLGIKGAEELVHYSAAKAGIIGMTRALAREVSPEINVNAIAPGPIETDLVDISAEWWEQKRAELPMDRLGRVEDVAPTAVFLASDESDYYTGQTLSPDGGDAMH